jgi:hypothetical protein
MPAVDSHAEALQVVDVFRGIRLRHPARRYTFDEATAYDVVLVFGEPDNMAALSVIVALFRSWVVRPGRRSRAGQTPSRPIAETARSPTRGTPPLGNQNGMPAHFSDRYEFDAPAEVVFGVLTDPDRVTRWLPLGMRAEQVKADRVRVEVGARPYDCEVDVLPEQMRLGWRSLDVAGLHGGAHVEDAPAGGSLVFAEVNAPDAVADEARLRDVLAETMRHLRRDVSDNFNAG